MSSDEIFAAHMWTWPDPMIKRDSAGRILFINAAFLKMYGGQVQDWQGNTVSGWPNPQMSALPNRFETRLPHEAGESVYDWVEYMLPDQGTLAIARDVTELLTPPQPDNGAHFTAPPTEPHSEVSPPAAAAAAAAAIAVAAPLTIAAETTAAKDSASFEAPEYDSPVHQAPVHQAPVHQAPTFEPPVHEAPVFEAPVLDAAPASSPQPTEPATPPQPEPNPAREVHQPPSASAPAPEPASEAAPTSAPEGRDYERRALPIENEEAVLGTNWRDAVIAKAVGSAMPSEADETPEDDNASATPRPVNMAPADGPLRILLAEDNAINALLTRTLLEAEGCDVDVVEDGQLAVEAMKTRSYDMIFMDMRMPNMDGLESTRKIRALPNVPKSLPIVALTANAFDDDRNACFDSGMNDFMTKPVSAEELADMVQQWARKQRDAAA